MNMSEPKVGDIISYKSSMIEKQYAIITIISKITIITITSMGRIIIIKAIIAIK